MRVGSVFCLLPLPMCYNNREPLALIGAASPSSLTTARKLKLILFLGSFYDFSVFLRLLFLQFETFR